MGAHALSLALTSVDANDSGALGCLSLLGNIIMEPLHHHVSALFAHVAGVILFSCHRLGGVWS
jgi:hypothetical protein